MRTYDYDELTKMYTLSEGDSQDLKVDEHGFRVWQDRTGEDEPVQYEILVSGRWLTVRPTEDEDVWELYA